MIILVLFAFLAGLATILAPCILPILPVVLSAGVTGGKRRPLGIVTGLVVSFTFFTLSLSYLVRTLGLGPEFLRTVAILILLAFGIMLLIPAILKKFEVWVSSHLPQVKSSGRGDFWGGILIGISLGLVWTPCVGPILASVITLAATSSITAISVFITLAYALGTSVPLLVIMYGGKNLLSRMKGFTKHSARIQQIFGVIMILTAGAMLAGFDLTIQADLLAKLPSSINAGITQQLEESNAVQTQLKKLSGNNSAPSSTLIVGGTSSGLPNLGNAPDFTGINHWFNSSPLTISQLKGKVVLVDFWTYSCINCLRTLPHLTTWYSTYKDQGFVIIGVHSPEFAFEQVTGNIAKAIAANGITYPVAQDNNLATWQAYHNQYWPAEYLIDAQGRIRYTSFGEGDYDTTEANIRALLKEAKGTVALPSDAPAVADLTPNENQSPETYLGTDRQSSYVSNVSPSALGESEWTLSGTWNYSGQFITSGQANAALSYKFIGNDMYLVMNPPDGGTGTVEVTMDGQPIGDQGGSDVHNGIITVDTARLYHIAHVTNGSVDHTVTLTFQQAGIKAFSFTFG